MAKHHHNGLDPHQTAFINLVRANTDRYRTHEVFRDFCELAALSLSNAVDQSRFDSREQRYLDIVGRYSKEEVYRFAHMLAEVTKSLENGFHDALGELFMGLELGDHWRGQFFTPYEIAYLMAKMTMGDVRNVLARDGFVTLNEPACGAGGMVIACAQAMMDEKINYQQCLHVVAVDADVTSAHMTYIQLALLHVPAIVVHGNSLSAKEYEHWVTPAHVLGGWDVRLRRRLARDQAARQESDDNAMPPVPDDAHEIREVIVGERLSQLDLFS